MSTSTATLLDDIRGRGIDLTVAGDDLRLRAPRGVLTRDLVETIRAHKGDLLSALGTAPTIESIMARQRWGLPPPVEFPLATAPPMLSANEIHILRGAIERQVETDCPEVLEWLLGEGGQADRYADARDWTSTQCESAAMLDLLLWQRERWIRGSTRQELAEALLDDLEPREREGGEG